MPWPTEALSDTIVYGAHPQAVWQASDLDTAS
jgi:hypothetical protein